MWSIEQYFLVVPFIMSERGGSNALIIDDQSWKQY